MTELNWGNAEKAAAARVGAWRETEPGGAIVVFDAGGPRIAVAGGVENLSTLKPFTADTVVRYASVTKHAFASLVTAHNDIIGLDDPLGRHLPELQPPLADVTVGQALDMTGGLPDVRECLALLGLSVFTETAARPLFEFLTRMTRLNFPAGTEISYSNTGYRLVETALKRRNIFFRDYIRRQGETLGVTFDAPDVWSEPVRDLAPGYWHDGEHWRLSAAGLHISASGSMTGSAAALAAWVQALMTAEGEYAGILEHLSARRYLSDGRPTDYGLGIRRVQLGSRTLLGHGGSHPGYKSHFLIDRESMTGAVIVANREDVDAYAMAMDVMAALTGEGLPEPATRLPDGLYLTANGPWWIEVKGSSLTYLNNTDTVYADSNGTVASRSPTSPARLRWDGSAITGEIGHAERRFLPADPEPVPAGLQGRWLSPEGAMIVIDGTDVIIGTGPVKRRMPLTSLGRGRFLFSFVDGPWTKRILLHRLTEDRLELVLSRARMIEYQRLA
ncbi:UNVERIFIED_ORG: CubicO group peptidase (beta-lactamase class C family) [Martelella mediterranea]